MSELKLAGGTVFFRPIVGEIFESKAYSSTSVLGSVSGSGNSQSVDISSEVTHHHTYWVRPYGGGADIEIKVENSEFSAAIGQKVALLEIGAVTNEGEAGKGHAYSSIYNLSAQTESFLGSYSVWAAKFLMTKKEWRFDFLRGIVAISIFLFSFFAILMLVPLAGNMLFGGGDKASTFIGIAFFAMLYPAYKVGRSIMEKIITHLFGPHPIQVITNHWNEVDKELKERMRSFRL